MAWSLNLHQPYDPFNPVDSIAVAARAINNIIGGATLTGSNGRPVVQPGLESSPANCVRYTGSAALRSRAGYPSLCARPVTQAGPGRSWWRTSTRSGSWAPRPQAAQNAAVLFQNSTNPGDPQVQAILKQPARGHATSRATGPGRSESAPWPVSALRHAARDEVNSCAPSARPGWQQANGAGEPQRGRGDHRVHLRAGTTADLTSPTSVPVHLLALEQSAKPTQASDATSALGHRQRGQLLPADGRDQDASRDGSDHLAARQHRRRRPRPVLRGVRQPHAGARRPRSSASRAG